MPSLIVALALLTAGACTAALAPDSQNSTIQKPQKPHVILMLVDELGTGDVPWYDTAIHAPYISELAETGLRLGASYAWHWCAPTRGALMSGRYPMHTGYDTGGTLGHGTGMPLEVPLLGEELRRGGYKTHMMGKWHVGFRTIHHQPMSRGFDSFFGLLAGGADHYNKAEEACGGDGMECSCGNHSSDKLPFRIDFTDGQSPAKTLWDNTTYDAYHYTQRAVEMVEAHDPVDPFFLYWAPHKVHSPLQCPEEFLKQYPLDPDGKCQSTPETCSKRGYANPNICGCDNLCYCNRRMVRCMVSVVDSMLLNLTVALKARGMWDNTIIVFLGDNGAPVHNAGHNSEFKGEKGSHWEGGHRVPTLISGGGLPAGLSGLWHNGTTHLVDLHATILDLAGVVAADPPGWVPPVDGVSLVPIFNSSVPVGTQLREELWIADEVLRIGPFKLITGVGAKTTKTMLGLHGRPAILPNDPNNLTKTSGYDVCTGNETGADADICKSCHCSSYDLSDTDCTPCLYNVEEDPGEYNNLAKSMPQMVAKMHARLIELTLTKVHPKFPESDLQKGCDAMVAEGGFIVPWE